MAMATAQTPSGKIALRKIVLCVCSIKQEERAYFSPYYCYMRKNV
jgi:hypothetical protein